MVGSHLDTQPSGGRFDGAFGVMAALEVAVSLAGAGHLPDRDPVVVAWMNEEGSRFVPGMMGSEAFAGVRTLDAIRSVQDADGISGGAVLDRLPRHAWSGALPPDAGFAGGGSDGSGGCGHATTPRAVRMVSMSRRLRLKG